MERSSGVSRLFPSSVPLFLSQPHSFLIVFSTLSLSLLPLPFLTSPLSAKVSAGDSLGDVETDKAVMSFDSTEDGVVAKLLVDEGTSNVPVGKVICIGFFVSRRPCCCIWAGCPANLPWHFRTHIHLSSRLPSPLTGEQPVLVLVENEKDVAAFKDFKPEVM